MKNVTIFDLDGTCIDSSHRQATKDDGTLDLDHWRENSTPEKVLNDRLLALASQIAKRKQNGDYVVICTARVLGEADYLFLEKNGMLPHKIISRKPGDNRRDGDLKAAAFRKLFSLKQFQGKNKVMFDDASSVRQSIRKLGIACVDPAKVNPRIGYAVYA